MKITILVNTSTKESSVTPIDSKTLKVKVKSLPIDGKANAEIIKLLAKYYGVRQAQVEISHGVSGRRKIVEIDV